ncbi:MAG TPA: hypothetical protein VN040_01810 [Pseudosphingobacterium sp.]|nr:hypothetical protein [Pseudosphingobacterium sp.]
MIAAEVAFKAYQNTKVSSPGYVAEAARAVAIYAVEIGFFDIWFKVFRNEPVIVKSLIEADEIPGTAKNCFDPDTFELKNRNPSFEDPI